MYINKKPVNLGEAWRSARLSMEPPRTLNEISARLGISESYLSLIETSKRAPTVDLLRKMAAITGLTMEALAPDPVAAAKPQ
jgi:transcriptional regulator with XRE-family HTH domain